MNLKAIASLYFGGEGSGCVPEVAESHGTFCGPAKKGPSVNKLTHFGKPGSKKIMGLFVASGAMGNLYKTLLSGEWHKVSDLELNLKAQGLEADVKNRLSGLGRIGKRLGPSGWEIQFNKYDGTVRMFTQKDVGVKGEITDQVQKAALMAVQQLIGKSGLDNYISKQVWQSFMKGAGFSDLSRMESALDSWSGSANGTKALYWRKVAADFYGRSWKDEYTHQPEPSGFDYSSLQKQALAVKTLAGQYTKTSGLQYVYRGITGSTADNVATAISQGKVADVPLNSLSSWSTSMEKARGFGPVVLRRAVNPDDVWATSQAMGHLFSFKSEKEVVMGSKTPTLKFTPDDVHVDTYGKTKKASWWKHDYYKASAISAQYKLDGKTTFQGLPISIETDQGAIREGVDKKTGKPWKVKMTWPYGYIRKTEGVDGDHVDVFIGPNANAKFAYVIHTKNPHTGAYDEDKCMLGFDSPSAARKAFNENYSSPGFFGTMDALPMEQFKERVNQTKSSPMKITAGGPGSGCRGSNCGRKMSGEILDLVKAYKRMYHMGVCDINSGNCKPFAKAIANSVPGAKILSVGKGFHYFVKYQGKYYDASRPNGVDDWQKLPTVKEGMGWGTNWKPKIHAQTEKPGGT